MVVERIELLESVRTSLVRMDRALSALSAVYRVPGHGGEDRLYVLARGVVRAELPAPRDRVERRLAAKHADRILGEPTPPPPRLGADGIAESLLVERWFRRRPGEMERLGGSERELRPISGRTIPTPGPPTSPKAPCPRGSSVAVATASRVHPLHSPGDMIHDSRPREQDLRERLGRLIAAADDLCGDDEQRRDVLVERAETRGVPRGLAERVYDLAVEERLPPAYGLAVAAAGVSVQPFESGASGAGETNSGEPDWVDPPPPPAEAALERRLRQTFRRVRSFVADTTTPGDAFRAFADEPDVEPFDY